MPNYIDINLSIMGNDRTLGEFTKQAKGKRKPTGDLPTFPDGRKNYNYDCASDPPNSVFEFDRLVPLPESYSHFPYDPHGYNLESDVWGVKWGAFKHKTPKFEEGCATYWFRCAWEAPRIFMEKVSTNWPDLWFVLSYGGEGPVRGRFTLHNGSYIENVSSSGYAFDIEPLGEDYWEEQTNAWKNAYRNAHEEYTKQILYTHILKNTMEGECNND